MKKIIFDYLNDSYNINVGQLLVSGVKNGAVGEIDTKYDQSDFLPMVYTMQKDDVETDFYLFCTGDHTYQDKIQNLINGLKILIGANSCRKVLKSSYDKEWYHWEDESIKISFGIKTEKTGFSMRITIPNAELISNTSIILTVS
jgi:hypothetical protein